MAQRDGNRMEKEKVNEDRGALSAYGSSLPTALQCSIKGDRMEAGNSTEISDLCPVVVRATVKPVCNDHLSKKFITCDLFNNVF